MTTFDDHYSPLAHARLALWTLVAGAVISLGWFIAGLTSAAFGTAWGTCLSASFLLFRLERRLARLPGAARRG